MEHTVTQSVLLTPKVLKMPEIRGGQRIFLEPYLRMVREKLLQSNEVD